MTAVDLLSAPELLDQAKIEFAATYDADAAWRKRKFFS